MTDLTKKRIKALLNKNEILLALLMKYDDEIIKGKITDLLKSAYLVANNLNGKLYHEAINACAYCLNELIRVLHSKVLLRDEIKSNLNMIKELRKNG